MKSKLTIICLLLLILCSISAVTAEELNETQTIEKTDANLEETIEINSEDSKLQEDSDDLQKIINDAHEKTTIDLSKNYTLNSVLKIDKTITINGNGNTLKLGNKGIESSSGKITLENLILTNSKNSKANYGGALTITGSAKYEIINCTFYDNYVRNTGGAIYNNVDKTLTITNSKFIGNHAVNSGGAIYSKGDLTIENTTFIKNIAKKEDGGAILGMKTIELTNCIFILNQITYYTDNDHYGGAVNGRDDIFIDNCTFTNNSANKGGAVYVQKDIFIEESEFTGNYACEGGAVYSGNDYKILIETSTFEENDATEGKGGAIFSNKWIHVEHSIFESNKAKGQGGAIYAEYIQFGKNCTFISNHARGHGGAVYTNTLGSNVEELTCIGNHADRDFGGALYINKKCPEITFKNSTFNNNYAIKGDGGAIYSDSGSTNLAFNGCTFIGNYVTGGIERRYGGAVRSCGNFYAINCTFKENTAQNYGGAVYAETSNTIQNCVFIANHITDGGKRDGGAIYINSACQMTILGNYFESNYNAERGGALYLDSKNAKLTVIHNGFVDNTATSEGYAIFNSGYYVNIYNNWWGSNSASQDNQMKEYVTFGSNKNHWDSNALYLSVSGNTDTYTGIGTTLNVALQSWIPYHMLRKATYSSDKQGSFTKAYNEKSMDLTYIPEESGTHTITIKIDYETLTFKVNAQHISVYGEDVDKLYGDNKLYSAIFKYENGSYLPNGTEVKFDVDNVYYDGYVEGDEGIAKLYLNLYPGTHTVKAINTVTGTSHTNTIKVTTANRHYDINDVYIIKIDNEANKTVTFTIDGKTYTNTTSDKGLAYLKLNVSAGNYTLKINYNGKVFEDNITVNNQYSKLDLGLKGITYGALLPVYSNETFIETSNGSMYSILGENTYRYVLASKQAFILYNVTVSNSEELTNALRKMTSSDFKADVIEINLKKNTYKITENFWRDSDWYYLIHLTHGRLFINGGGSTIKDEYHHNFICCEANTNVYIKNVNIETFYRVFSSNGKVHCVNSTFTKNDAQYWATKTPGSVIYNKNTATFENCIFNANKNDDVTYGAHDENTMGGVLYADANSVTTFYKCKFLTSTDNIRAVDTSMIVIYDNSTDYYKQLIINSYLEVYSSFELRQDSTYNLNKTYNQYVERVDQILNANTNQDNTTVDLIRNLYNLTSLNITLKTGEYVIKSADLEKVADSQEWRTDYIEHSMSVKEYNLLDINSKPVVINGNGAKIKLTGNSDYDDDHFAYIPKHGSLTLINLTLSGFNTALLNYGTLIVVNCTFTDNIMHHRMASGDYGGAIRNYGNVYCYNTTFSNNGANKGGAYYSEGASANAVFYNCTFGGNKIKSNWVWKNNDENALYITKESVVKLVDCKGIGLFNIKTEDDGLCLYRDDLENAICTEEVDSLCSLMKVSKIISDNEDYDIINVTFTNGDYGVFPDSNVFIDMDYGLLILNGDGSRIFVQNAKDNDETRFLATTIHSNVQIRNLTVEGFNIAITNDGTLTIMNSILNNNRVDYKIKSDYGGAIVNNGGLNVFNTTFSNNYAKYGGGVYNTGTSQFIMCNYTNNIGYNSKSNVDIYNKEGSVDSIIVNSNNPVIIEKFPMAQWKQDLLKTGFMLLTLAVTSSVGWAIMATEVSYAYLISLGVNGIIGGAFGAIEGFIYSNDQQDYSSFWAKVMEGVTRGLEYNDIGDYLNGISPSVPPEDLPEEQVTIIISEAISRSMDLVKDFAEAHADDDSYDDIFVYAFFKGMS